MHTSTLMSHLSMHTFKSFAHDFDSTWCELKTKWTFQMAPSLISYSRPGARLLRTLNFAMISHRWASVKQVASGFINLSIWLERWKKYKKIVLVLDLLVKLGCIESMQVDGWEVIISRDWLNANPPKASILLLPYSHCIT